MGRERKVLQAATGVWGSSMAVRAAGRGGYGGVVRGGVVADRIIVLGKLRKPQRILYHNLFYISP